MQIQTLPNGGKVAHKVTLPESKCRFSVWFDASGVLLDAERIDAANRSQWATDKQRTALADKLRPILF